MPNVACLILITQVSSFWIAFSSPPFGFHLALWLVNLWIVVCARFETSEHHCYQENRSNFKIYVAVNILAKSMFRKGTVLMFSCYSWNNFESLPVDFVFSDGHEAYGSCFPCPGPPPSRPRVFSGHSGYTVQRYCCSQHRDTRNTAC